ncbi:MAG: hypothetical protein GC149_13970 [Gammaproteobacteria bacterium]|nr:hypothetical protein [Gammaproteobacteria bacterium]
MSFSHRQKLRYYALLIGVVVALVISPVRASEFARGVLWAVSKPGLHASYILGTIHSDDPRVTQIPAAVAQAFANSRSFTGELDMSVDSLEQTQQAMLLPEGSRLKNILGQARFNKCVKLMADYGVPDTVVNKMKPWAIAVQLNMPKPVSDRFLDLVLYQQAVARAMPVHALETIPEQIAVFDRLPVDQQIILLDEAIANYESTPALIDTLIDLYLARDLAGLQAVNDDQMQKGDLSLAAEVEQRLIVQRNHRMVARMQARLIEGDAFIAVGALHLPGKEGILNLLEQQGYQVKYVY